MQITLVQIELEQAIREYVGRQLTTADGLTMSIEWFAGRKEAGFSAIIDIVPVAKTHMKMIGNSSPKAVAASLNKETGSSIEQINEKDPEPTDVPEEKQPEEASFTVENEAKTEVAADTPAEPQLETNNVVTLDTEVPPPLPAPRSSLFKDLRKPKNT